MKDLSQLKCIPCRKGDPAMTDAEMAEFHLEVPEWEIVQVEGIKRLQRVIKFSDFLQALDLANRVGEIAEEQDHHPMLVVEWGRLTIQWWTHMVKGLHRNDFILAAKTDGLLNPLNKP